MPVIQSKSDELGRRWARPRNTRRGLEGGAGQEREKQEKKAGLR